MDNEGSVPVDGETGLDTTQEGSVDETGQPIDGASKEESQGKESVPEKAEKLNNGKDQLTEKGTKIDPDPMSALNQNLANEKSLRERYEKVLIDPEALQKYAKTMGLELTKKEAKEIQAEEMTPDKIETVDDLKAFARQLQQKQDEKFAEVESGLKGIKESDQVTAVSNSIREDVTAARSKWPELDPKSDENGNPTNPDYDPELDAEIGELFNKIDLDPATKRYRGGIRLMDLASSFMKVRNGGTAKGSKDAQTIVREKRIAKTQGGAADDLPDESNMTATQILASRMRQMSSKR